MAELRAALAPGDDFATVEVLANVFLELIVAGHVAINDFAIVENCFYFLRSGIGAESERCQRGTARFASESPAGKKTGAECSARISSNGLDVDIFEAASEFESTDKKGIQENATGYAKRIRAGGFTKMTSESNDEFFKEVLRAARNVGADGSVEGLTGLG